MKFTIYGMTIYYESIGSGLPIIMIHGNGPDHRSLKGCMEPCFTGLDDIFKRIYFDLPGFGKSKGNEWLSDANKMLELLICFIDGLFSNQPLLLVGNSYGGYLARGILKKKQNLVKGLLLLCPSLNNKTLKSKRYVLEKDPALDSILSAEEKSYFEPIVVRQTVKVWSRYKEEILPGLKLKDHDFYNTWGKSAYTFSVDDLEYPFDKPALIIMGKQDSIVGYSDYLKLFHAYPRATLVVLDIAGHALQIEQPELFTCLTKEWLERVISFESSERNGAQPIC